MFRAGEALKTLQGKKFSDARALRTAVAKVRAREIANIPAEFGTSDLIRLAQRKGWVTTNDKGHVVVRVKP